MERGWWFSVRDRLFSLLPKVSKRLKTAAAVPCELSLAKVVGELLREK